MIKLQVKSTTQLFHIAGEEELLESERDLYIVLNVE